MTSLIQNLNHNFFGFEDLFYTIDRQLSLKDKKMYPPHNVIQNDDNSYTVELAVAGYSKDDLIVEVLQESQNKILRISGKAESEYESKFITKNISCKSFIRNFWIGDYMEVGDCTYLNGMLTITIQKVVPEDKKPIQIKIK